MIEMINNMLLKARSMNVLNLLSHFWNRIMSMRFNRWIIAKQMYRTKILYIFYANILLDESKKHFMKFAMKFFNFNEIKIIISHDYVYDIRINFNNYLIECNCRKFQILNVFCDHVLNFFRHQNINFQHFMSWNFFIEIWTAQHRIFVLVVRVDCCKFDSHRSCDFFYTKSFLERSRKQKIRFDEKKTKT